MVEEIKKEDVEQKPKEKGGGNDTIFIIIGLVIAFGWLLYLTNIATLLKVTETDLPGLKEKIAPAVLLFTILYVIILVFNFYLKDKLSSINSKKSNAVIVVSSHERIIPIRTIAKEHYHMNLGELVYSSPLTIFKETGAVAPTRFYIFENLDKGIKTGHSQWYEHYVNQITTHLHNRNYQFFATKYNFKHGESKSETSGMNKHSLGLKRREDMNMLERDEIEGNATE